MRGVKKGIATALARCTPATHPAVMVASMGRSGSTLVHNATVRGMAKARFGSLWRFGEEGVRGWAFKPEHTEFRAGVVYKTHALRESVPDDANVRVIFVFGTASTAVLSVLSIADRFSPEWVSAHFDNMNAQGTLTELPTRDVLRLEEQIDSWHTPGPQDVLAVKYDTLWTNVDAISDFVGYEVRLPPRRPRAKPADRAAALASEVKQTYKRLDEKIQALPDLTLVRRTDAN